MAGVNKLEVHVWGQGSRECVTLCQSSMVLSRCLSQLAAQVLEDLKDEDIGFGLVDEKKDSAVAKKLGKCLVETSLVNIQYIAPKRVLPTSLKVTFLHSIPTLYSYPNYLPYFSYYIYICIIYVFYC